MTERVIGVDFGTSTSVIRVKSYEDGAAVGGMLDTKAVTFNMGMTMTPTLVQKAGAELYFGFDATVARRNAELISSFKADLEHPDESIRQRARDTTARFLKFLADAYCSHRDGGHLGNTDETERTIISYPVKWSAETKAFMRKAAKAAGFPSAESRDEVEGRDEAQAAIQAVTVQNAEALQNKGIFQSGKPVNILLIDMGAGTTDLVLCRHMPGAEAKTEILCTYPKSGDILFGGSEVDTLLRDYIRERTPEAFRDIVLKRCSTETFKTWKETIISLALQKDENVSSCAPVDSILDILGAELEPFHLDRQEFETCAKAYLKQFPELVTGCIREAGLSGGDVDLVILTGGHSQWYFVKEMLSGKMERFGKIGLAKVETEPSRIISLALPQETVALGLAYTPLANVITAQLPETEAEIASQSPSPVIWPSISVSSPMPDELIDQNYVMKPVDGGYEVSQYIGHEIVVNIPAIYKGLPVIRIGECAFAAGDPAYDTSDDRKVLPWENESDVLLFRERSKKAHTYELFVIEKVTIPDTCQYIGPCAFINYHDSGLYVSRRKLREICFGNHLLEIGDYAFHECASLKGTLYIPDSCKLIGDMAFTGTNYDAVEITPNSQLQHVAEYAFFETNISEIILPNPCDTKRLVKDRFREGKGNSVIFKFLVDHGLDVLDPGIWSKEVETYIKIKRF